LRHFRHRRGFLLTLTCHDPPRAHGLPRQRPQQTECDRNRADRCRTRCDAKNADISAGNDGSLSLFSRALLRGSRGVLRDPACEWPRRGVFPFAASDLAQSMAARGYCRRQLFAETLQSQPRVSACGRASATAARTWSSGVNRSSTSKLHQTK
jgi:hypothetical protein